MLWLLRATAQEPATVETAGTPECPVMLLLTRVDFSNLELSEW